MISQQVDRVLLDGQGNGVRLTSNQVQFSLLYRKFEKDGLLAAAKELGISIISYSPLAQGLLSGAALEYLIQAYSAAAHHGVQACSMAP